MMKKNKAFTLIELLIVIAIIGILTAIVIVSLTSSKNKANDSKIQTQLKQMEAQAQLYEYTYGSPPGSAFGPWAGLASSIGASSCGNSNGCHLFGNKDSTNSLYTLLHALPTGTKIYIGWNGAKVDSGGKWFLAANGSSGTYCVDWNGLLNFKSWTGITTTTPPAVIGDFTASGLFTSTTVGLNGLYSCQ